LIQQLQIIKPKIIVLLGRHAMNLFFPGLSISKVHGQAQYAKASWSSKEQLFLPLYHPAAALYNPNTKKEHFADFTKIAELLKN